ncbi:hypothetical protein ACFQ3Z_43220 [Streptomyces nogalater]
MTELDASSPTTSAPRLKHRGGIALALIAVAQLMVVLDATIVNVALPRVQAAVGFSTEDLSWVVNAYTLTYGGLLLLGAGSATSWAAAAPSSAAWWCSARPRCSAAWPRTAGCCWRPAPCRDPAPRWSPRPYWR